MKLFKIGVAAVIGTLTFAKTETGKGSKLAWRQDLTPKELLSIDLVNIDSKYNDQFKIPQHEAHAIRKNQIKNKKDRRRLRSGRLQQGGEEFEVAPEPEEEKAEPDPDHMCNISLAYDSRTNLYMLLSGYIMGLYDSKDYPQGGCTRCEGVALPFSMMVHGLSNIVNLFSELIENDLSSMSPTE